MKVVLRDLNMQVFTLSNQNISLSDENRGLKEALDFTRSLIDEFELEVCRLSDERQALRAESETKDVNLSQASNHIKQLVDRLTCLQTEIDKVGEKVSKDFNQQIGLLPSVNGDLLARLDRLSLDVLEKKCILETISRQLKNRTFLRAPFKRGQQKSEFNILDELDHLISSHDRALQSESEIRRQNTYLEELLRIKDSKLVQLVELNQSLEQNMEILREKLQSFLVDTSSQHHVSTTALAQCEEFFEENEFSHDLEYTCTSETVGLIDSSGYTLHETSDLGVAHQIDEYTQRKSSALFGLQTETNEIIRLSSKTFRIRRCESLPNILISASMPPVLSIDHTIRKIIGQKEENLAQNAGTGHASTSAELEFADASSGLSEERADASTDVKLEFADASSRLSDERVDASTSAKLEVADASSSATKESIDASTSAKVNIADASSGLSKERADASTSAKLECADASSGLSKERADASTSAKLEFADASSGLSKERADASTSAKLEFADASSGLSRERADASTSPKVEFADASSGLSKERADASTSAKLEFADASSGLSKETVDASTDAKLEYADASSGLSEERVDASTNAKLEVADASSSPTKECIDPSTSAKLEIADASSELSEERADASTSANIEVAEASSGLSEERADASTSAKLEFADASSGLSEERADASTDAKLEYADASSGLSEEELMPAPTRNSKLLMLRVVQLKKVSTQAQAQNSKLLMHPVD
ncbi:hypothetical protein BOX15_Mlig001161g3 [Macrostomum lignano]|uniref:Uncharacterized protein n=1 Tax=Macrostomum lignano TaxID=282301 RepID=A0A267FZD1_9PLAT|nr:hypothetical protein BOX15_Mlig001161g3 [Macrostomum lignano]